MRYKHILFVCTGNSCRSPIAKALFEKLAKEKGLDIEAKSAGISALSGLPASMQAIESLKKEGLDISDHRSSPLNEELVDWADLILVMEEMHKKTLMEKFSHAKDKVYLLREFAEGKQVDISDPIGKPKEVYEELLLNLKQLMPKVIARIEG